MTIKTILRTTLALLVALTLVAVPAAAAVPDEQSADRGSWMLDLRSLVERVSGVLMSRAGSTEQSGNEDEPPPPETSESCEACSDGGQDMDPDG